MEPLVNLKMSVIAKVAGNNRWLDDWVQAGRPKVQWICVRSLH
jgi:hypothetical protein